jgi:DNA-binding phage protein
MILAQTTITLFRVEDYLTRMEDVREYIKQVAAEGDDEMFREALHISAIAAKRIKNLGA